MDRKQRTEFIEKYLKNQLEGFELRRFEDELEKDDRLKRELLLERELREVIDDRSDYNIFRRTLNEASTDYFNQSGNSPFQYWKIAASVALLISASAVFWLLRGADSPDTIFNKHFEPYIIQTTPRSLIDESDDYMLGVIHYRDQEYEKAISQFERTLTKDSSDYRAQLLLGISYLAVKDFNNAEPVLKKLALDNRHLFQDQARFNLGLLYLTDGDEENDELAKEHFERIEDRGLKEKVLKLK
ncbi:MAG: tetratricopeptide repeat protein [Cyclobacteriaceae bacterium]